MSKLFLSPLQAQAMMQAMARRGFSGSKMYQTFRDSGFQSYRKTDMLRDYRKVRNVTRKASSLNNINWDKKPSITLHRINKTTMTSNFRYKVKLKYTNNETGKEGEYWTHISSDQRMTRREIIQETADISERAKKDYKMVDVTYSLEDAERNE